MAVTIKALIDGALRKLGVLSAGQQPAAHEYADGLAAMRQMLDTWSLEALMVPFVATERFPLTAGKALYSVGPGGDWDTVRPEEIETIRIEHDEGSLYPVFSSARSLEQFQSRVTDGRPGHYLTTRDSRFLYIEFDAYPTDLFVLVTSRKPFNAAALENFAVEFDPLADPQPVYPSGFTMTGILTPLEFGPGYESAIIYNLALHLVPEYPGVQLPELTGIMAVSSKNLIKRANWRPTLMVCDPALLGRSRAYDVNVGPYG